MDLKYSSRFTTVRLEPREENYLNLQTNENLFYCIFPVMLNFILQSN